MRSPFSTWLSGGAGGAGPRGRALLDGVSGRAPVGDAGRAPVGDAGRAIGSFEHGGEVHRDGVYELEKGEVVTPAKKMGDNKRDSEYRRVFLKRKKDKK
jgi:hypothetical protein